MAWDLDTTAGKLAVVTLAAAILLFVLIIGIGFRKGYNSRRIEGLKQGKFTTVFSRDAVKWLTADENLNGNMMIPIFFVAVTVLLLLIPSVIGAGHDAEAWVKPLGWGFIFLAMGGTFYLGSYFAWQVHVNCIDTIPP